MKLRIFCVVFVLIWCCTGTCLGASTGPIKFERIVAKRQNKAKISVSIKFKHTSKKKIKRISMLCALKNKIGKKIPFNARKSKKTDAWLEMKGDMKKGKKYVANWDGMLINKNARTFKLYQIEIVYKNGDKKTIDYIKEYKVK